MVQGRPTSTTFLMAERIMAIIAHNLKREMQTTSPNLEIDHLLGPLGLYQRTSLLKQQPIFTGDNLASLQAHLTEPIQTLRNAFSMDSHSDVQVAAKTGTAILHT